MTQHPISFICKYGIQSNSLVYMVYLNHRLEFGHLVINISVRSDSSSQGTIQDVSTYNYVSLYVVKKHQYFSSWC